MTTAARDLGHRFRRTDHLSADEIGDVLDLAAAAGDADGAYPLSEHVALHVRHGGDPPAVHLLARDGDGTLAGYAHVDTADGVDGPAAELVVHPMRRRHGLGRALAEGAVGVAEEADPRGRLRLWSHGDHPSAGALAHSLGFARSRVLFQMRRSLSEPVPVPGPPDGVRIRGFRPGEDETAWLAVNARAFAGHPDQGRWTRSDLSIRMAEPWFDPAGFLVAEGDPARFGALADRPDTQGGTILGFHWTKVHGGRSGPHPDGGGRHHHGAIGHDAIGEVYVLGVDPVAQGLGLGTLLALAGLRHLRERGLDRAMLYVDESNTAAVTLYGRLGFFRWSTDVNFRRIRDG